MSKEKATDRRMISATVDIEVCMKVERKYRLTKEDSQSQIYARALEDATRDVLLTAEDYREIARETEDNLRKREAKRRAKKGSKA